MNAEVSFQQANVFVKCRGWIRELTVVSKVRITYFVTAVFTVFVSSF